MKMHKSAAWDGLDTLNTFLPPFPQPILLPGCLTFAYLSHFGLASVASRPLKAPAPNNNSIPSFANTTHQPSHRDTLCQTLCILTAP